MAFLPEEDNHRNIERRKRLCPLARVRRAESLNTWMVVTRDGNFYNTVSLVLKYYLYKIGSFIGLCVIHLPFQMFSINLMEVSNKTKTLKGVGVLRKKLKHYPLL